MFFSVANSVCRHLVGWCKSMNRVTMWSINSSKQSSSWKLWGITLTFSAVQDEKPIVPAHPKYAIGQIVTYMRRKQGTGALYRWIGEVLEAKAVWDRNGLTVWYVIKPERYKNNHHVREDEVFGEVDI